MYKNLCLYTLCIIFLFGRCNDINDINEIYNNIVKLSETQSSSNYIRDQV